MLAEVRVSLASVEAVVRVRPMGPTFSFSAEIWVSDAGGSWVFATVPEDIADEIEALDLPRRGFGSVKVNVYIGETEWSTSLFPDKKVGSYIFPVKGAVRTAERLDIGDVADFSIEVVVD